MAIKVCIPQNQMDIVEREILTSGNTSKQRLEKFVRLFGDENGQQMNLAFERSLLNKKVDDNIDSFVERFAKKYTELSPEELKAYKAKVQEKIDLRQGNLSREDLLSLTKNFVDKKYKTNIDIAEAENIAMFKQKVNELQPAMKTPEGSPERLAYGRALSDYKHAIKEAADVEGRLGLKDTLINRIKVQKANVKYGLDDYDNIVESSLPSKIAKEAIEQVNLFLSAINKGFQASGDISFLLRQGRRALTDTIFKKATGDISPSAYFNAAGSSIRNMVRTIKNGMDEETLRQVRREFEAKIFSSDVYELALKHKLAVTGITEDYFVDSIAEKVPGIGRLIATSDNAFSEFSQIYRLEEFKNLVKQLNKNGQVSDKTLNEAAEYVNSKSGRGGLGGAEKYSRSLNNIFYSARYISSNIKYFTNIGNPKLSPAIRRQAQKDVAKDLTVMTTLLLTLKYGFGMDVELDPRSSKFAHVKVGDRWIDTTAGLGAYVVLGVRSALAFKLGTPLGFTNKEAIKNAQGKISGLNTGSFGGNTVQDLAVDWSTGKLSPTFNIFAQISRGKDYQGNEIDLSDFPRKYVGTFVPLTAGKTITDIYTNPERAAEMIGYGLIESTGLSVKK